MIKTLLIAATLISLSATLCPAETKPSLEFKIGQMLMVGFRGLRVDGSHPIAYDIKNHSLGGVVLYDNDITSKNHSLNIESPNQLKGLTEDLQTLSDTPLFIAMDYEGGAISRLKESYGFPATKSHMKLGMINDKAHTYAEAGKMAEQLDKLGINFNLAPVVDVNTNSKNPVIAKLGRSFSDKPEVVSKHALAYIEASQEKGIITTLKHFPGHGSSDSDSHLGITDVTDSWSPVELEPFRSLIEHGKADVVMTAHVFNWRIDPDYPATLSKKTIGGLLRDKLKYDGVVMSDDMQMKAISDHYGLETAVIKSIEAGIDIMVFSKNADDKGMSLVAGVKSIILEAIKKGQISESRIDTSYQRILRLKKRLTRKAETKKIAEAKRNKIVYSDSL